MSILINSYLVGSILSLKSLHIILKRLRYLCTSVFESILRVYRLSRRSKARRTRQLTSKKLSKALTTHMEAHMLKPVLIIETIEHHRAARNENSTHW